jgi:hypothetical protein
VDPAKPASVRPAPGQSAPESTFGRTDRDDDAMPHVP